MIPLALVADGATVDAATSSGTAAQGPGIHGCHDLHRAKTSADAGRAADPGDRLQCGADPATAKDDLAWRHLEHPGLRVAR
jgi:hypothetical protein